MTHKPIAISEPIPQAPPKFKVGDIVRVRDGGAALCISVVRSDHGGLGQHRYWGWYLNGSGGVGLYEDQIGGLVMSHKPILLDETNDILE